MQSIYLLLIFVTFPELFNCFYIFPKEQTVDVKGFLFCLSYGHVDKPHQTTPEDLMPDYIPGPTPNVHRLERAKVQLWEADFCMPF